MGHANNIITAPVNIMADVGYVIGTGSGDIGVNCTSININRWAKYKPVINTLIDTASQLNPSTGEWASDSNWWKGSAIPRLCGFSIPLYSTISDIIGTDDVWEYIRPTGTNWKRLLDFNQYNHNAERPYTLHLPTSVRTGGGIGAGARIILGTAQTLPQDNLLLTDIGDFSNYYFGIIVARDNQAYIKTNAYTIGSGSGEELISFDGCPLIATAGNAEVYAVLTPSAQTSWINVYESSIWSLNCDDGYGHVQLTIIEPAENVYRIVINGLSFADMRVWGRITNVSVLAGDIFGSSIRRGNMSTDYAINSVTWTVVKNSDQSTIVRQGTLSSSSMRSVLPSTLDARDDAPGSSVTFSAPYEVGTLPPLQDPTDYYIITYNFNYI